MGIEGPPPPPVPTNAEMVASYRAMYEAQQRLASAMQEFLQAGADICVKIGRYMEAHANTEKGS